jgi:beta-1,4-N-acetylglucosaminyltransferase
VSNGPGTCVPFFFIFYVLNKLKAARTKLIFIESWCRVDSISLSGKIVRFFTDKFIVHWEEQKAKHPWTDYYGKIL